MTHSTEPNDKPIMLCKCGIPHHGVSFNNTLAVYTCNNCQGAVDLYSPRILDTNKPITPKPKIVQFQVFQESQFTSSAHIALLSDGRLLTRSGARHEWLDITGEIPE